MEYNADSRAHDSGYFTPSPDKENKLNDTGISYQPIDNINHCILNGERNTNVKPPDNIPSNITQKQAVNGGGGGGIGNHHDMDRPPHSYIALISMAILSKMDKKILLNEIYDWVVQNFPYYQHRTDKSWRNSIRHNLSLNECFIKVGKAGNGRGYYWSIHPANLNDFKKGDFRRRQARLRAKHDKSVSINTNTTSSSTRTNRNINNHQQQYINNTNTNTNNNTTTTTTNHANTNNANNTNINMNNHYLESTHQHLNAANNNNTNTNTNNNNNTNTCNTTPSHLQIVNSDNNQNFSTNMNLNCISTPVTVPHSIPNMPPNVYHHPNTQQQNHHQYNYVATFPWLPSAAAAAAAQQIHQSSTTNFLESFTSSALACGYNSIIPQMGCIKPHNYQATNEMSNDNSLYYHHNFHNKQL